MIMTSFERFKAVNVWGINGSRLGAGPGFVRAITKLDIY